MCVYIYVLYIYTGRHKLQQSNRRFQKNCFYTFIHMYT